MAYGFESAVPFLKGLQGNLDPSERVELEKAAGASATEVGLELARSIPNIISKPLDIDSLESQFKVRDQTDRYLLRRWRWSAVSTDSAHVVCVCDHRRKCSISI